MGTRDGDGDGDDAANDSKLLARVDERQRGFGLRLDATDGEVDRLRVAVHDLRRDWTPALTRAADLPKLEDRVTALERNESSTRVRLAIVSAVGSMAASAISQAC